jgi:CheY-like chemotaxis protein
MSKELRILCVEDDKPCMDVLTRFLEKLGYQNIKKAYTASEADYLMRKFTFDVIFMDLNLPRVDGGELTQNLRTIEISSGGYASVIGVTGVACIESERKYCYESGMNYIISKPYTPEEIAEALQYCGFRY